MTDYGSVPFSSGLREGIECIKYSEDMHKMCEVFAENKSISEIAQLTGLSVEIISGLKNS